MMNLDPCPHCQQVPNFYAIYATVPGDPKIPVFMIEHFCTPTFICYFNTEEKAEETWRLYVSTELATIFSRIYEEEKSKEIDIMKSIRDMVGR